MLIKTTNHYLTPADLINAMQLPGRNYIELDGIRLVVEDGEIHGWYNPGYETVELLHDRTCESVCSARNCAETKQNVPSEDVA